MGVVQSCHLGVIPKLFSPVLIGCDSNKNKEVKADLLFCSQKSNWKDEESQLSQQIGGLTNEVAALQVEKLELSHQCQTIEEENKKVKEEIKRFEKDISVLSTNEEKRKKTIEELEVIEFT